MEGLRQDSGIEYFDECRLFLVIPQLQAAEEAIRRMAEAEDALETARQEASRLRGRLSTAESSLKVCQHALGSNWL